MIDTVIFDFDGTLADTSQIVINSFKHIYSVFRNEDCDEDYVMSTFGEPLRLTLQRDFEAYDFEDVITCYREYQVERFNDEVRLYETVKETLDYLKDKNIKMGITTSRLRNSTLEAVNNFNIKKYFDAIITADDVKKHKPDKEPLIKTMELLNSKAENTLYVGDSRFDMECAINSNVIPVLCGWHKLSEELKNQYNVKYVLNKMIDIKEII
ncbi:HAD-IA family hydrolase [Sedimentibacter sp.]|uniref:HAD-IA family hydrolase n=1 Tax=Sedimentibacter sp. TaxID=1960295 RepID=UPI0028AC0029|nr:HAD-IA family hydrolase [Sedimentibacter sp.]